MKHKFKVLLSSSKNDVGTDKKLTITSSCFHPERSLVYCGLSSGAVLCYDYTTRSQVPVSEFPAHTGPVRVLAPHPRHAPSPPGYARHARGHSWALAGACGRSRARTARRRGRS